MVYRIEAEIVELRLRHAYLASILHALQMPMHIRHMLSMASSSYRERIDLHLLQTHGVLYRGLMKHVVRPEDPANGILDHARLLDLHMHIPQCLGQVVVLHEGLEDTVQPVLVSGDSDIELVHCLLQLPCFIKAPPMK